jgi:hypothetical protein
LARAVDSEAERDHLLAAGTELLRRGAVGHNHLWFYRDAIEAMLVAGDAPGALRYVELLDDYTRAEPLPWSELFAARGRALVRVLQGQADGAVHSELARVRTALLDCGLRAFLAPIETAIAV